MAVETHPLQIFAPTRTRMGDSARPDYWLIATVGVLACIGLLSVFSASFGPRLGQDVDPFSLIERQVLWLLIGGVVLVMAMFFDYHSLARLAVPMLVVTLVGLVLVLMFGKEVEGAKRWIFESSIQPGELAKIVTVIYVAVWATSKGAKLRRFFDGFVPFGIIVGLVSGLILVEPNASTALLIAITALAMFFIAGADAKQLGSSILLGSTVVALVLWQTPRLFSRVELMWTDVFKSPGSYWQLEQTLIAIGSGGLFGKGLGTGVAQYGYVPLAHSDGIFAIWGEETGLVGTWILVGLILFFAFRGFRIAANARDDFGRVLATGLTFWLTLQALVHIGVAVQLLPFTGQPLPFVSYGGSAMVMALAGVGLLLSISRNKTVPVKSASRVSSEPRESRPAEKQNYASFDYGGRNRRPRVSTVRRSTKPRRRTRPSHRE